MIRLLLFLVFLGSAAQAQVRVRDADTIVVQGTPVRFQGVDAPEMDTLAGQEARRWMVNYLRGKSIECKLTGEMNGDRYIGTCYADGKNLSIAVIAAGHALDCEKFSGGKYRKYETLAAKSRLIRAKYCR